MFGLGKKKEKTETEDKAETLTNAGIAGAAAETVQRYGQANQAFLGGLNGVNYETGDVLKSKMSLKTIANGNINPQYEYQNIQQQAGFSAEIAKTSRDNAENIINKNKIRTIRADDHPSYSKNDTVVDLFTTINGQEISGTGSQMKFVGDPKDLITKIAEGEGGGKNDLSRYLGASFLDMPSDQVNDKAFKQYSIKEAERLRKLAEEKLKEGDKKAAQTLLGKAKGFENGKDIGLKEFCNNQASEMSKQAEACEQQGKRELAEKYRQKAKNYESVRDKIRDSGLTTEQAVFYREHPNLATALDIGHTSHLAGIEAAQSGAAIAGGMSLVRNIVAVAKGEKDANEAAMAVVKDTGTGAVVSYATGFTGSTVKSLMASAGETVKNEKGQIVKFIPNKALQSLSKTNLPGMLATAALETGKTLGKYFKGEIDGVECLTELGEKGTGMVSSAMFTIVGQAVIPIPVIGGMIGSMIGYALSSACYGELVGALQEAKLAHEERIRIEKECAQAIAMIRQCRAEMEKAVSVYLVSHIETFHYAFDGIKDALKTGDIDGFIANTNTITKKLGKTPQFETFDEFDALMESKSALRF